MSKFSESSNFFFIAFLFVLLLISHAAFVYGQEVNFELVTGTQQYDDAKCIIQTLDSGYAVVGSTSAFGNGQSDIYLTKISKKGTVTWQQAIGGKGIDRGNALIQTPDSGFAITGYSNSAGTGGYDIYLVKTDKNGVVQWSNTYGGFDWDFGNSLLQTTNGDYVICGSTFSFGKGEEDVYLLKTNSSGVLLWDSAYGGAREDAGNSVCESSDGGYFITGYTKSFGQGNEDVYLLKTDSNGNLQWTKTYGGAAEDKGNEGKNTTDGGFIVIGVTKSLGTGKFYDSWLLKTNSSGDTLWTRTENRSLDVIGKSVCQTSDGEYIIGAEGNFYGSYDMFMRKINGGGILGISSTYGGGKQENAFSVKQTFDGGYVLVGTTESYGPGVPNIYIIKTGPDLKTNSPVVVVVGIEEKELIHKNLYLYPNPASDHFTVNAGFESTLEIFDLMGRMISSKPISTGNNRIDTAPFPNGVYFIRITNSREIASAKIIVSH